MNIIPINFSDFESVVIKNKTPHCIKHGAMNKITKNEDGGGYWRCISIVSKIVDTVCRTGCCEVRNLYDKHNIGDKYTMDGKPELWTIAYYPITECGKTGEKYNEPRALVEMPIKNGIDYREVPLRYLTPHIGGQAGN